MSLRRVLVIGAGAAGTAAALAASRAGAEVTIADGGPTGSALMSGAVDLLPWERVDALTVPLPDGSLFRDVLASFGRYRIATPAALLASMAGCLRTARGCDRALLDLEPLRNARVAVPHVARGAFDSELLVRGLNADSLARDRGIRFHLVECEGLLSSQELAWADNDIARNFDGTERVRSAAACLREAAKGFAAILMGPWLGLETDASAALGGELGVPVGETLSMLSGPAGARFELARDRVLADSGATRLGLAVDSLQRDRVWRATLRDGSTLEADAVVIAVGGMISGGISLSPSEGEPSDEFPAAARSPFGLSFACDELRLRAGASRSEIPGSLLGPNLEDFAWPVVPEQRAVFERVGLEHDDTLRALDAARFPIPGCFVAGAAAAEVTHTLIAAIDSGARAGALAAVG